MKTICLLSSGHLPEDERIFEKFSLSLKDNGFKVIIILTTSDLKDIREGVEFDCFTSGSGLNAKIKGVAARLKKHNPQLVIAGQPLMILAAKLTLPYTKVISDITEWYPENVTYRKPRVLRQMLYAGLAVLNFAASFLADGFIFGEKRKARRYRGFSKKSEIVSYYPVAKYFRYLHSATGPGYLNLLFAGYISPERGANNLLRVLKYIEKQDFGIELSLRLAVKFQDVAYENFFRYEMSCLKKTDVTFVPWQPYRAMENIYRGIDLYIDLREKSFIYDNSLPIKLFESLAFGVPVLYNDLKVFREDFDLHPFGYTVNAENAKETAELLRAIAFDKKDLIQKSQTTREEVKNLYNWEKESGKLISFVTELLQ
ncbi:MAG: hypothetical protein AMXMBFR48_02350 [Ignavibacteriales bacterium]